MSDRQIRPVDECVEKTVSYLGSPQALESIRRDPYWPKWDSPWWHMTLLWEMGLAKRIPSPAAEAMVAALKTHYIQFFPLAEAEIPSGVDPYRGVPCHCAIGTMHQVLSACGAPMDAELAWLKRWLLRYQLPDGGLNCAATAYRGSRKSSIVSTLPALEAVLRGASTLSPAEEAFVDRGARYLIAHKLVRSTEGRLIDPEWLKLCFPRFYEYDLMRGLTFLLEWSKKRGKPLPPAAVSEAWARFEGRPLVVERYALERTTLRWDGARWKEREPAATFPLLETVSRTGQVCGYIRPPEI